MKKHTFANVKSVFHLIGTYIILFGNSRLKVSFFWPFKADYWIVGLDPAYRWAVVGNPNRKYLWVLSRSAQLPPSLLEAALASASQQGFDLTQLRYTPQAVPGSALL